jgi:hypothetical protein
MLGGFLTHLALYGAGFLVGDGFKAVRIAHLDPLIPGIVVSLLAALLITWITAPPPQSLVRKFFYSDGGT